MKTWKAPIALVLAGLITAVVNYQFSSPVSGQAAVTGATPVQSVQPFYSCNLTQTATGAANTAVTLTMTPNGGECIYLCDLDISVAANAAVTGAAGPAPIFTTTNLPTNLVWWGTNETLGTGAMRQVVQKSWGVVPLKTNTGGTPFTIVTSAGQSTMNVRINATGFSGKCG